MTSVAPDCSHLVNDKSENNLDTTQHNLSVHDQSHQSVEHNEDELEKSNTELLSSFQLIKDLDLFLVTAPVNWHENQVIRRYFLNKEEGFVSCVYWNNLYFITGTDIVRCIAYKMGHIGREIIDRKKFEEGIFSDLRALKCGTHAVLENSRSPFLKFLHRNQCLRTQKKQKVFFWFSVPHNKLFADVLERDLKRELTNQPTTTRATSDLYSSFSYDQSLPVMEQLTAHFSKQLKTDVSGYLLKNQNILASPEEPVVEKKIENQNTTYMETPDLTNKPHNNFSDEFPLDFLNAATNIVDGNYTSGSYDNNNLKYVVNSDISNSSSSPKQQNSQMYQNYQQGQSNTTFPESLDGIILNNFNQPLFSATFPAQQNPTSQPMYIVSSLPTAIDPKNTFDSTQNGGKTSPSQGSQYFPIHTNNGIIYNNDQYILDHSLYQTEPNAPQTPYMLQVLRSQSPSYSNSNTLVNFPSSGLIPIAMPSATFRCAVDELFNNSNRNSIDKTDTGDIEDDKNGLSQPIQDEAVNDNELPDTKCASHDYMMLSMPSLPNSSNKLNFGLVNGQLFTPGTIGIDYNLDNAALSAGVGISPVIGFNNGLVSAIQYSASNRHYSSNFDDASEKLDDKNTEKKLKGIIQNENNSKITKGKRKPRLLNPSLQHLQLDSLFDEAEHSFEDNDLSVNEDATIKTEG